MNLQIQFFDLASDGQANIVKAGFGEVIGWIFVIAIVGGGIIGVSQKIGMLYAAVGTQRFWKGFKLVVVDIIAAILIFLLLDGLKGLTVYVSAFVIAIVFHGLGFVIFDSESTASDTAWVIIGAIAYRISYLAIFAILLAPLIGIVMFLGLKFGGWELFWR